MSSLIDELQLAVDQDATAFNHQMFIKQALIERNIMQFPDPPQLERQNHYVFDPIKEAEFKPTVSGYVRLASALQAWMDTIPHLTVVEIVDGIMQMRNFFDREHISWMHPTVRDMSIIYMLRSKAPASQNLNMAIRRIILLDKVLVYSFNDPYMFRTVAYALKHEPRATFTDHMFRKDCEIALARAYTESLYEEACEFGPIPYSKEELFALSLCVRRAIALMVRLPAIRHHYGAPLSLDALQLYMHWGDDIQITYKCAYIIGLAT